MPANPRKLTLASSSEYRRGLLKRIYSDFEVVSPEINEAALAGELPAALAGRLAIEKAQAVAAASPQAIVIGSDQVADLKGQPLGKPGDHATAAKQLAACSGQSVIFHTGVCVTCQDTGFQEVHTDTTTVNFRELSDAGINAYLQREQPWGCAGSFRAEGLGPVLFHSISSSDPTGLIGLPLIWLAGSLQRAGLTLL
jgi:septum formation protein